MVEVVDGVVVVVECVVVVTVTAVVVVTRVVDVTRVVTVVLVVVGAAGQWHSLSQTVPLSHKAPGGSHCSPRSGVTTPSPQPTAQSLPAEVQHV